MKNWETKDSGERVEFETGAVRDVQEGKSRVDLISAFFLNRLGYLLARGAKKYGERNWEKGQSTSRALASLCRHLNQYMMGEVSEDHLAAVAFNAMVIMDHQERVKLGKISHQVVDDQGSIEVLGREGWERTEDGYYEEIFETDDDEVYFPNIDIYFPGKPPANTESVLEAYRKSTVIYFANTLSDWVNKHPGHYLPDKLFYDTPYPVDRDDFNRSLEYAIAQGLIWTDGKFVGTEVPF